MRGFRRRFHLICGVIILLLAIAFPSNLRAQAADPAAAQLAKKILNVAGPRGTMFLEVRNLSSLGVAEFAIARRGLQSALRSGGFDLIPGAPAEDEVRVTVAENVLGHLWVAEIRRGGNQQVVMVLEAKSLATVAASGRPSPVLQKKLVYSQASPILDFAEIPGAPDGILHILILEPEQISFYDLVQENWNLHASSPIRHKNAWPRDLRGRIELEREGVFEAYLPGFQCGGYAWRGFSADCMEVAETSDNHGWPFNGSGEERSDAPFPANRNFFAGYVTTLGENATKFPAFYSGAPLKFPDETPWIFAGLDGKARLYENSAQAAAAFTNWGSDITALGRGCGSSWQILVTSANDWTQPDSIQAYEIVDRQAVAIGQPADFSGPVMSLWPATDGKSANVIARNLKTGEYEAYALTVVCNQ
ncbi:MAG: hypothetical protein ACRD50_15795 [Candidatus Acidiferrales bacterium]